MRYAIAVGSNRGDREQTLARAAEMLAADGHVTIEAQSALLENPAVGGPEGQDDFLNGAWVVATRLGAHQLLLRLRRIEDALGRVRSVRNGPRTIDLDLLLAEDGTTIESTLLSLPHPRLHERHFVLQPLREVAGGWQHPIFSCTVEELWQRLG